MAGKDHSKTKFHISFSEYRQHQDCNFRHLLSKLLQIEEDKNESLIYGSTVHNSIEYILVNKVEDQSQWADIAFKELSKETSTKFAKSYFGKKLLKQVTATLDFLDVIERYGDYEVVAVEEQLYEPLVEIEGITVNFKGFIDLVLRKGDHYVIIDWKTANRKWDIDKKKKDKTFFGQLALYRFFYARKHNIDPDNIECRFVVLPRDRASDLQSFEIGISEKYGNFILDNIEDVAEEILFTDPLNVQKAKGTDKESWSCRFCPFKNGLCNNDKKQVVNVKELDLWPAPKNKST